MINSYSSTIWLNAPAPDVADLGKVRLGGACIGAYAIKLPVRHPCLNASDEPRVSQSVTTFRTAS
jgi:hypothetical protein